MHVPNPVESDPTNPYIQIMFNINSKKVVNNNIVSDRGKDRGKEVKVEVREDGKEERRQEKDIIKKGKKSRLISGKGSFSIASRQDNLSEQNTKKAKKKQPSSKRAKSNLSGHQTQRSCKNQKKGNSEPFSKAGSSQECQASDKKATNKQRSKPKSLSNSSKDTREKIIGLMIRDYERGEITGENLKVAIGSLIEREMQEKKGMARTQCRSERPVSRISTSYKNSLAQSLHATPKHKPSKSKSQKFHYNNSYQPSMMFRTNKQPNIQSQQPPIIERIIHNKEFMSKIIIKGVNSSLFLSNEWTEKESPSKEDYYQMRKQKDNSQREVDVDVIVTSDSVRELKREMGRLVGNSGGDRNVKEASDKLQMREQQLNQCNYSNTELIASKLNFQKQKQTKTLLSNFIQQLNISSRNQFISPEYSLRKQNSLASSANSLKYFTRIQQNNHLNIVDKYQSGSDCSNVNHLTGIDNFDNDVKLNSDHLRIEQLQQQYALLLKDRSLPNQSSEHYRSCNQRKSQQFPNYNQAQLQNSQPEIFNYYEIREDMSPTNIKSYLSSQLQNKLQNSGPLSQTQLQVNQKRAKSITQNQIKKLNQIMDVIKHQLTKKQSISTNTTNNENVLNKIVNLLETEKTKVQQELKLYGQFDEMNTSTKRTDRQKDFKSDRKQQPDNKDKQQRIEQNQIINSFQKKLKKLNIFPQTQNQPLQNKPQAIHFQSSQIRSLSSSRKSITSNSSSHHLQKIKISQLNLDQIEMGLNKRLNDLCLQKQQQLSIITEKFINDKISAKQYHEEGEIIGKWFDIEEKQLKRTKKNLLQGYKKAQEFLLKEDVFYQTRLTKEKSNKMIKCISEKYLEKIKVEKGEDTDKVKEIERGQEKVNRKAQQNRRKSQKFDKDSLQSPQHIASHQTPYQTIQELQGQLLIRNITHYQKQQRDNDILSPLSIQQSRISQQQFSRISQASLTQQNNYKEILMTLQECGDGGRRGSQNGFHGQDEISGREGARDQGEVNGKGGMIKVNHREDQYYEYEYEYEQVRTKRPQSASKIHNQIQQYLKKYQETIEKEENRSCDDNQGDDNQEDDQDNDDNCDMEINQFSKNDKDQHQADVEESQDQNQQNTQEYFGYNQTEQQQEIDIDSSLHSPNYKHHSSNHQSSLTSSQTFIPPQQHPHIIINKPSLNQDEIFSPKKPSVHQQFSEQLLQYNSTSSSPEKLSLTLNTVNHQLNETFLKLKYLTDQDKDDIFEFMFLDLCLELFLEQTKNNKIMKAIERYLVLQRRKKKIPKGFKTGLDTCKLYITQIQQFLSTNYFSTLKRLQCPMGPSAKEMLKFMRDYDDTDETDSQLQTVNLVLPIEIYEKFQTQPINKLMVQRYYDDDEKEESRLKFLKSLKHFHNKAIFDSLNEMLDVERSYGIWGKPFPWKKALDVDRKFDDNTIQKKLNRASQKLVENCSYFCGVLIDKEQSVFGKTNVSEEYLHHIREDRMSKMLSNDMIDNEDRWIFYDDEETEVLVSISKSITAGLIAELLQEMKLIAWK